MKGIIILIAVLGWVLTYFRKPDIKPYESFWYGFIRNRGVNIFCFALLLFAIIFL